MPIDATEGGHGHATSVLCTGHAYEMPTLGLTMTPNPRGLQTDTLRDLRTSVGLSQHDVAERINAWAADDDYSSTRVPSGAAATARSTVDSGKTSGSQPPPL